MNEGKNRYFKNIFNRHKNCEEKKINFKKTFKNKFQF